MSQTQDVIDALDDAYPPTNPAVLLAAARDAYLSGLRHRQIVRLLSWTLYVIANNVPDEVTPEQRDAIVALYFAPPRNYAAAAPDTQDSDPHVIDTRTGDVVEALLTMDEAVARAAELNADPSTDPRVPEPEDDEWTNREGMPEFDGSFR